MAPVTGKFKLDSLRKLMSNVLVNGKTGIQAYIVTSDDAHQSEYIQARDERRAWISGFKGSYGTALVTLDKALLWTDGRYFTQAALEFDPPEAWTLMKDGILGTPSLETWLADNLPANSRVGVDPHLISNSSWNHIQNGLSCAGHTLEPIENNLIDEIWGNDQPPRALNEIVPHKICYSGKIASEKVKECFEAMEKNKASVLVVTALDEIAYLLNWRGSDIPYNPVFFAYAVLYAKQVHIFVDDGRLNPEAKEQLGAESVDFVIHPYLEIRSFLKRICNAENNINKVWVSNNSSYALHSDCKPVPTHTSITPVMLMKLIKNETEIQGMKNAHIRDGVALVKYYSWLESKVNDPTDSFVTEISGANQLEKFRREQDLYVGPSFSTISSSGAHGAIIHYKPAPSTDIPITNKEIYLCDAGAQFLDGTTDVTRTFHFGEPSAFEKECYTRVFKGQCNLSMTKFPSKTVGNYLDTLARKHLWDVGLNYLHGTGHGVGSYLNVHEFPAMISWRAYPDDPGLQAGMFLSNEPGYYEDGKFGIRLENIEMIKKSDTKYSRLNNTFLQFETVTMVPIQTRLLDMSLLTDDEVQYLNDYHSKCYEALKDHLQGPQNIQALNWLKKETQPIGKSTE